MALLRLNLLLAAVLATAMLPSAAQDDDTAPERPAKPPVLLIFTPPDLAGRIVLGIFDARGRLRRTLAYDQGSPDLKIDTNGYVAQWDGLDDAGKPCSAGRYAAHGYVVGEDVAVEGEAFHFNDWMAEDAIPALDVNLQQWSDGMGVEITTPAGAVHERIQPDGTLVAALAPMEIGQSPLMVPPDIAPSPVGWAAGRDGTTWLILEIDGQHVVLQLGKDNASLRELRVPKDEPQPLQVLASPTEDEILLKETGAGGRVRVRMLRRGNAEAGANGRVTADWEIVFERTMEPCAKFGVVDGKLVADAGAAPQPGSLEVPLVPNTLEPGSHKLRLSMSPRKEGSALIAPDGLELVEISSQGAWNRCSIAGDGHTATLYQGDGIVVEEFGIRALDHIAAFDAGEFLLAPAGQ